MKLKNKKTGEIGWLYCDHISVPKKMTVFSEDKDLSASHWDYNSLAELNEEWEDYEEPKHDYYFIRDGGNIDCHWCSKLGEITERRKEIGNYFDTREEAEKAVERLRAWKRLKDKQFKFYGWNKGSLLKSLPNNITFACDDTKMWSWEDIRDDLDLLFGGEE